MEAFIEAFDLYGSYIGILAGLSIGVIVVMEWLRMIGRD